MRLCSKLNCLNREGKGYRCSIGIIECPGERTEEMLLKSGVNKKDIKNLKEEGLL
jgi:hypothetical protein